MTDMHTKSNVSKAKDFVGIELKLSALTTECLTNIHNYVAIFGGIECIQSKFSQVIPYMSRLSMKLMDQREFN